MALPTSSKAAMLTTWVNRFIVFILNIRRGPFLVTAKFVRVIDGTSRYRWTRADGATSMIIPRGALLQTFNDALPSPRFWPRVHPLSTLAFNTSEQSPDTPSTVHSVA